MLTFENFSRNIRLEDPSTHFTKIGHAVHMYEYTYKLELKNQLLKKIEIFYIGQVLHYIWLCSFSFWLKWGNR